jgi:hypothetical protein
MSVLLMTLLRNGTTETSIAQLCSQSRAVAGSPDDCVKIVVSDERQM